MPDPLSSLLVAGLLAGLAGLVFWPDQGILARWRRTREMNVRVRGEDALKHIHLWELDGRHPTVQSVAGALHVSANEAAGLLAGLESQQLVQIDAGELGLTPQGRDSALHIIRAHRLWERYLAEETGFSEAEWHGQAERLEHDLTPAELDDLAAQLGHPTHDPHGDPIPTAEGEMVDHGGRPLTTLDVDTPAQIVHLEDEPEVIYAQLAAEGLHPGQSLRVTENTPERIRFWTNGDEHVLAPIVAGNISVVPLPEHIPATPPDCQCLSALQPGETGEVVQIVPTCRGAERRRFLDLGVTPGTAITAEMRSPGGEPTAYRIRGALIALRRRQAEQIKVRKVKDEGRREKDEGRIKKDEGSVVDE